MNTNDIDKDTDMLVDNIREQFDASVAGLDGQTVSRITRIRYSALEDAGNRSKKSALWLPAGAFASACLALLVYTFIPQQSVEENIFIDEIDIISELDFYEDLDFYEWLDRYELPS